MQDLYTLIFFLRKGPVYLDGAETVNVQDRGLRSLVIHKWAGTTLTEKPHHGKIPLKMVESPRDS